MGLKIFLLLFLLNGCNSQEKPELYQHWIHSHEEDNTTEGYRTYRPSSYNFPPSRGRDGFEIKKNGVVLAHPIAPTDGNLTVERKWKIDGDQLIMEDDKGISTFQIISIHPEKIVLKPLYAKQ